MVTLVKKHESVSVSVKLEFEGTVRSHVVTIENQYVPTINNQRIDYAVRLDGDPIQIAARFAGSSRSKVKKFEVTINNKTWTADQDLNLKGGFLQIVVPLTYKSFDLKNK